MMDALQFALVVGLGVAIILIPVGLITVVGHFLLLLPMYRRDRALFFLDLLETVLQRGTSVEQAIVSAAENCDRSIGIRYFLVAAHIERGARLGEALEKVPTFLPPQVNAILRTGEKLGDLKKILPACREVLRVAPDTVRTTAHYMMAILLFFSPIAIWLICTLSVFVIPRFKEVAAGMAIAVWPLTAFVFEHTRWLIEFELVIFLVLAFMTAIYVGGPGFVRWFQFKGFPVADWIAWRVPWKRKKLQRTFSAMLAVLLDSGVPETEAVRLSGECTANRIGQARAKGIARELQQGVKLDEAVRAFDESGEFHWRLTNAVHARGGFLAALRGWHESLDARAFRQQETATHVFSSGLVVLNGVVVGLIATSMFGIIITVLKGMLNAE
ncbi:MAG TPA: type II secretion system F family protein [Desulfuromonadaceae bacterium]|nr:type II secretion system F family protein [Desulfuromonadaceae bacterium]